MRELVYILQSKYIMAVFSQYYYNEQNIICFFLLSRTEVTNLTDYL